MWHNSIYVNLIIDTQNNNATFERKYTEKKKNGNRKTLQYSCLGEEGKQSEKSEWKRIHMWINLEGLKVMNRF